jgi:hypothetical protein
MLKLMEALAITTASSRLVQLRHRGRRSTSLAWFSASILAAAPGYGCVQTDGSRHRPS